MAPFKLKFRTSSSRNASQEASTATTSDTSTILNEQQQQTSISSLLNYSNLSEIGASNSTIDSAADCTSIESYSNNDRKLLLSSSSNNPSNTNSILGYLNPTLSQSEDCVESNKSKLSYDRTSKENLPNNMESENLTLTTFDSVNCLNDSYSTREMNSLSSQDHHNVDDSDTQSLQECTDPDCKMYNSSLNQNNDNIGNNRNNENDNNDGNNGDRDDRDNCDDDDDDETISHNETSSIDYLISNNANNSTSSNIRCNDQNCVNNELQQQQQQQQQQQLSQSSSQLSLRQRESQQQQQQRYYESENDNSLTTDNRDNYQWNQSNNDHNQNDDYNNYQQLSQQSQQQHHHQHEEITIPEIINNKSSKKIYKAIAKQSGISCKMSDQCRCMECQSHYFDCEFDDNDHQKTDGGLGAGTPMFISEVMHGSACTIL